MSRTERSIHTKKLQIVVSTKTARQLEEFSKERQLTKSVIVQLAVEQYIASVKDKECLAEKSDSKYTPEFFEKGRYPEKANQERMAKKKSADDREM
jgi:predicted DNA-binding protein